MKDSTPMSANKIIHHSSCVQYSLVFYNSTVLITLLIGVCITLSYKDVEIIPVSLTEHLLLTESLAKTAFLWCFLLVQPIYHLPSWLPPFL